MILNESNPTPMDLRFRLFGTYVRVHPLFWLFSAVLGWNTTQDHVISESGMAELAVWIGCAFFSILLHEFGHVWMGRLFGSDGYIVLQAMGGLAVGSNALARSGQRILVCAAGPLIQLVLSGILLTASWMGAFDKAHGGVHLALDFLLWINLFWALVNLLPVFPLDGGQIAREIACNVSPSRGLVASLWISFGVSLGLALIVLAFSGLISEPGKPYLRSTVIWLNELNGVWRWIMYRGFYYGLRITASLGIWGALLFAMFAAGAWQAIQAERYSRYSYADDDALPWER